MKFLKAIPNRFKKWRKARELRAKQKYWDAHKLEHLRTMLQSDNRWLAHDPVASALTDRYLAALSDDWYAKVHESSYDLRVKLNLEPEYNQKR